MEDKFEFNDTLDVNDGLTLNLIYSNPIYQFFPQQILALTSLKGNPIFAKSLGINIMYIPVLTMFIESCLSELMNEYLLKEKDKTTDTLKKQLINDLEQRVIKGWKDYKDTFHLIFNIPFDNIVDSETVKAVGFLFELRNRLIHGENLSYNRENVQTVHEKFSWGKRHDTLYKYFIETKLIGKENETELVNDKVIKHFLNHCMIFTKDVIYKMNEISYLHIFTLFNAHVIEKLQDFQ